MPDVFTKSKRSQVMARIRSRGNNDTEVVFARHLRLHGITGWRRHQPVFGRPDFVFRTHMLAVFVDGCFWHGCPQCYRAPSSNRKFWYAKYQRNKARDRRVSRELRKRGWCVLRIWEHQLSKPHAIMARLHNAIESRQACTHHTDALPNRMPPHSRPRQPAPAPASPPTFDALSF